MVYKRSVREYPIAQNSGRGTLANLAKQISFANTLPSQITDPIN